MLTNLHLSILIGLLLSDGTLVKRNKGIRANAYFSLTQTINPNNANVQGHIDLVNFVFNLFRDFSNFSEPHIGTAKLNNKIFQYTFFNTISHSVFTELYNNWYIQGPGRE